MSYWDGHRWADAPATTPPPRKGRRMLGAAAEAALITMLIFGLIAGTTLAAKGGNAGAKGGPSKGSLTLLLVEDHDANGLPNHAETITFDVATTATDKPYVNVRCYQAGAFVYDGWVGYFPGAWFEQSFTLSSSYWTGGAADCNARLVMFGSNGRERTLAEKAFGVGG